MAEKVLTTVNVNGKRFQISNRSFQRLLDYSNARILSEAIVIGNENKEYFFERNADSFAAILDLLSGGQLHLPPNVCPNVFQREMLFWGVDISRMENCCYNTFITFKGDRQTLEKFERKTSHKIAVGSKPPNTRFGRFRASVWSVLDEPSSSIYAKIFTGLVILFSVASVFVIVASTHPLFQRNLKRAEWQEYLGDDFTSHLPALRQYYRDEDDWYDLYEEEEEEEEDSDEDASNSTVLPDTSYDVDPALLLHSTTVAPVTKSDKLLAAFARLDVLRYIEYASMIFFTIEFIMRIAFCPSFKMYFFSLVNVLDFVALSALYVGFGLELFIPAKRYTTTSYDLIQCVQFMRIFRFLRLVKNVTGFRVLIYSFTSSARELLLLLSFLAIGILIYGSLVYYAEDASHMKSIPDATWFALITMTTVGYGDMVPKTFMGKIIAALCAISGVLLIAVTVPIFVNTFILFYNYSKVMDERAKEVKTDGGYNKIKPTPETVELQDVKS